MASNSSRVWVESDPIGPDKERDLPAPGSNSSVASCGNIAIASSWMLFSWLRAKFMARCGMFKRQGLLMRTKTAIWRSLKLSARRRFAFSRR